MKSQARTNGIAAMLAVLSILLVTGQLHRSSGAVLLPALAGTLDLNVGELASIISALFLAQGLSQIPVGIMIDRLGPRVVIPALALVAAIGTWVFAASSQFSTLAFGRLLMGVGFSAVVTGSYVLITRWVPAQRFSTMSGRVLFIGGMGGLFATTPLALLIESAGWRTTYNWLGAVTLVGCVLTYLIVRDGPAGAPIAPPSKGLGFRGALREWGSIFRHRRFWPILVVGFVLYSPQQILLGLWAGPFLDDVHHLDAIPRSHILLAMAFGMNIGSLLFGPIERRLNVRRPLVLGCMLFIAAAFTALASFAYASLWQSAFVFCVISLVAPFFIVTTSHALGLYPQHFSGRVMSTLNMTCIIGVVLVQNLTGAIVGSLPHATGPETAGAYRAVFATMGALFFVAALVYRKTAEVKPDAARPLTLA